MIEVVIAASVTLGTLTGAGLAVANTQQALIDARTRDQGTSLARGILERQEAFGCALAVRPDLVTDALVAACASVYGGTASALDAQFTTVDGDGREFELTASSRWVQPGTAGACLPDVPAGAGAAARTRPAVLERSVELTWTVAGVPRDARYTAVTAAPASAAYLAADVGGLLVFAPAGTQVSVKSSPVDQPLTRIAQECTGSAGGSSAAWFPYLPAGTYLLGRDGSASTPVDVLAGQTTEASV